MKPIYWIVFAVALLLAACEPTDAPHQRINHYRVGQYDLYVPYAYVRFPRMGVGDESGLLQAYYPGGAPVVEDPRVLYKRGLWHKDVQILFTDLKKYPAFNPEKVLAGKIRLYKAHKVVGEEYGLTYQTQLDGAEDTWPNELWIERQDGNLISLISCRKKYTEGVIPHCTHRFHDRRFVYEVTYDKRFLPEWRLIRENVLALMASFDSEASARAFLADQITKTLPTQIGESP